MDNSPDYRSYSLEELYDVAQHIDREKYPERYAVVAQEILKRRKQWEENSLASHNSPETKGGCVKGCAGAFIGAIVGIAAAILWLWLFPPPHVPNMDGLNQWGGHIGLVMLGFLVGSVCGTFVAVGKQAFKMLAVAAAIITVIMIVRMFL